jgi:hypothetical protein
MLTTPHSLASATLAVAKLPISKKNEQEHSFAEAVDRSKLQEARTVNQKAEKAAHLKRSQSS